MSKDPAVLLYTSDFLSGTMTMTDEQVGKYIRLLCLQHQKGFLAEKDITYICRTYDEDVYSKFVKEDGKYYNVRMREEAEKRKKYSESRKNNINKRYEQKDATTYVEHMENENEDTNANDNAFDLNGKFDVVWKLYPVRQGKKHAEKHFKATVKTDKDYTDIQTALRNYLQCDKVKNGYIQNGSTWFNDWQSWIEPTNEMMRNSNAITSNGVRKSDQTARATYEKSAEQVEQDVRNTTESIRLLRQQRS